MSNTKQAARIARAAKHTDAVQVSPRRYAHYADETGTWWVVSAAELAELCDYLDDPDTASDAYSHWCAGTSSREMPRGWTPS